MPLPDDRLQGRGQALAYPEAVLLVNPVEPQFKGEVLISSNNHFSYCHLKNQLPYKSNN